MAAQKKISGDFVEDIDWKAEVEEGMDKERRDGVGCVRFLPPKYLFAVFLNPAAASWSSFVICLEVTVSSSCSSSKLSSLLMITSLELSDMSEAVLSTDIESDSESLVLIKIRMGKRGCAVIGRIHNNEETEMDGIVDFVKGNSTSVLLAGIAIASLWQVGKVEGELTKEKQKSKELRIEMGKQKRAMGKELEALKVYTV
eukprot:TRINITY_DN1974_c0_g2_i2.p1 TRINITY_DN1974_c0_g2~~TRINITY_DN1974_c0_g2_i2.p1  ORF type:complete len:217 (+),score=48.29 TRINITY_DN1974_c0_g2_i2:52-651(+)